MDPCCVLSFGRWAGLAVEPREATTSTKTAMKGGTQPVWEETVALPVVADPGSLRVQVFNQNRAAPDDLVGFAQVGGGR
jgi:Ca2+-dependent lipid-binding protein